jgi:hypothetical protein
MLRASLLVFALLAAGSRLAAQVVPSPYRFLENSQTVTVYGGYVATERGDLDTGPHSGPLVGIQYLGRFAGPLSGTAGVSYIASQRTVFDVATTGGLTALGETDAHLLQAEAGLEFTVTGARTWHSLAPFIGATVGLITDLAGGSQLEEDAELGETEVIDFGPSFAVGGSAGTDWYLTERVSIRAAARGHLWRFTTPAGLAGSERTEWLKNGGGTLGVAIHF